MDEKTRKYFREYGRKPSVKAKGEKIDLYKMKMITIIFGVMIMVFLTSFIVAEPTQQYNKVNLNPFYVPSITKDTNYTFDLIISPPDKISDVLSAMVVFQTYATSSPQDIKLKVNNLDCKNPIFSATLSGYTNAVFECSNIINKEGQYFFTLSSTKDLGSTTGWIDLTYMNNPIGDMDLFGTEYSPNDPATIFLQLKNNQGLPISDGACYLDIYNPLINSTHSLYLQDAPMLLTDGGNGMYYYDLTTPSILGVYMLSASCSYTYSGGYVYELEETLNYPNRTQVYGSYIGSEFSLNDYANGFYTKCDYELVGGIKVCEAYYDFNTTVHFPNITNFTNLNLYYMGETSVSLTGVFYVWNWTDSTWIMLPNSLIFSGEASSTSPSGLSDYVSNSLPLTDTISADGIIRVRIYSSSGSVFYLYNNWLNIKILTAEGVIQDIKGSSEMHLTDIPQDTADLVQNLTVNVNTSLIAEEVWDYNGTINNNILFQFASTIWNWTGTISSTILNAISGNVWTHTPNRNLTYYEPTSVNETLIAQEVWTYLNRSLSEDITNSTQIADEVWSYVNRSLTLYETNNLTASDVWGYFNRTLTNVTEVDVDEIADTVWNYVSRNLTFTPDYPTPNNLSAQNVWEYSTRELTYYPTTNLSLTNDSIQAIGDAVWQYQGTIDDNILEQVADKVQCYLNQLLNEDDGEWGIDISSC